MTQIVLCTSMYNILHNGLVINAPLDTHPPPTLGRVNFYFLSLNKNYIGCFCCILVIIRIPDIKKKEKKSYLVQFFTLQGERGDRKVKTAQGRSSSKKLTFQGFLLVPKYKKKQYHKKQ